MADSDHDKLQWQFGDRLLDLDRFLTRHPGGSKTLLDASTDDLLQSMRLVPHSPEAFYLLRDLANSSSEEDLVDWKSAMLPQVGCLGMAYTSWVWRPVDRPLTLFQNAFLESLSRTSPTQVLSFWLPTLALLTAASVTNSDRSWRDLCLAAIGGCLFWPIVEYTIHRWLFHLEPPSHSPTLIRLHFTLHGIHHKVPFDEDRLLFPPVPAAIIASLGYLIYSCFLPAWAVLATLTGTIIGYLGYDLMHFYLHHGSPPPGSYLYSMKRYHNQHHFAHQQTGFGISSDLLDRIFNTTITLKELREDLDWSRPKNLVNTSS